MSPALPAGSAHIDLQTRFREPSAPLKPFPQIPGALRCLDIPSKASRHQSVQKSTPHAPGGPPKSRPHTVPLRPDNCRSNLPLHSLPNRLLPKYERSRKNMPPMDETYDKTVLVSSLPGRKPAH